jgi:hypothetical protein
MIYHNNTKNLGLMTAGGVLASMVIPVWAPAIATAAALTCFSAYQDGQKAKTEDEESEPITDSVPSRSPVSTRYEDTALAIYQRRAAEAEKARRSIGFQID